MLATVQIIVCHQNYAHLRSNGAATCCRSECQLGEGRLGDYILCLNTKIPTMRVMLYKELNPQDFPRNSYEDGTNLVSMRGDTIHKDNY